MRTRSKVDHPLYGRWYSMIGRCKYPSHTSWKWYGAKGIKVCDRWLVFENFLADMGQIPFPTATIERRNNRGDYSPDNCYWATPTEQAQNRSDSRLLFYEGIRLTARQWSEKLGIRFELIQFRLDHGWSVERIFNTPPIMPHLITFDGRTLTRHQWSSETGLKAGTIWFRLKKGWTIEKALTTPTDTKYHNRNQ